MSGGDELERADLERALRAAHLMIAELRDDLHALAAQVVALGEQLAAQVPPHELAAAVAVRTAEVRDRIALADVDAAGRLALGADLDKHAVIQDDGPPCLELLPICHARCCKLEVALSTQDLDEGELRWDYARPYLLAKRDDGHCRYLDTERGCTVYARRPGLCRSYDCRDDPRIWENFAERILAAPWPDVPDVPRQRLVDAARDRKRAMFFESRSLRER